MHVAKTTLNAMLLFRVFKSTFFKKFKDILTECWVANNIYGRLGSHDSAKQKDEFDINRGNELKY